ncbi:MAG: signal peptidase I, partial [Clostridia bacterium]|nr:signal peptidase I [Clostridia bacterium]
DVLLVKETNANKINVGDDVVYLGAAEQYDGMIITHQVIDIKENNGELEFYTKGIANNTPDPVVFSSQLIGVVQAKIYTLTFITNILLNIYSLYFIVVLPIIINLFFREIHSKDRKERFLEKRRKEIQEEQEQEKKKEQKSKEYNTKRKRGQITDTKQKRNSKKTKNEKS